MGIEHFTEDLDVVSDGVDSGGPTHHSQQQLFGRRNTSERVKVPHDHISQIEQARTFPTVGQERGDKQTETRSGRCSYVSPGSYEQENMMTADLVQGISME
eukprot:55775-Hanusia_phi.AAC.4